MIPRTTFLRGVSPTRVRYVAYSGLFQFLLLVAVVLTYIYFFGVPGVPDLLPHLCRYDPIWDFLVKGFEMGMR
jgi:hypothetical protein